MVRGLLVAALAIGVADAFRVAQGGLGRARWEDRATRLAASSGGDDGESWRDFRAKLVAAERSDLDVDLDGWAYESELLERGSVILGGLEQSFGFGLRQQYFHKAVILLLEHDEHFTKGIIINRPAKLLLDDDWGVSFGGDVRSVNDPPSEREYICLHSLTDERAKQWSLPVVGDVQWTTLDCAKELVRLGDASQSDFRIFVGYAGWSPGQLQGEVERGSWVTLTADAKLWNEVLGCVDPDEALIADAGVALWETLMRRVGRETSDAKVDNSFADDMLREWARSTLLGQRRLDLTNELYAEVASSPAQVAAILGGLKDSAVSRGAVLRASSPPPPSVVLQQQYLHRSLVLVLEHEASGYALGAVLNRPGAASMQFRISGLDGRSANEDVVRRMLFGGEVQAQLEIGAAEDDSALVWLHRLRSLEAQSSKIGGSGVWLIAGAAAADAIRKGKAAPEDFLVLSGLTYWASGELEEAVREGHFQVVPRPDEYMPWEEVWALAEVPEEGREKTSESQGIDVWRRVGALLPQAEEPPPGDIDSSAERVKLADRALLEFCHYFLDG